MSIIKSMKRLFALIGVVLLLLGLRFYDTGLCRLIPDGQVTKFSSSIEQDYDYYKGTDSYRIDLDCSKYDSKKKVEKILLDCQAIIQFTEMDGNLIYAYSPRIPNITWVHGKRVNIMIYFDTEKICVGVPLLKGCY